LRALTIGQSVAIASTVYGLRFDKPKTTWLEPRTGWSDAAVLSAAAVAAVLILGVLA
jgi:hypothetical protein